MKNLETVGKYHGETMYTISRDKRNRFHVHRIGEPIKSMIPGFPDGPERKAYRVGKMVPYGNRYRRGWKVQTFKTYADAMMTAIADDQKQSKSKEA